MVIKTKEKMKKKTILALAAAAVMCSACGSLGSSSSTASSVLGSVLSSATNTNTLGNILGSVLGTNKISASNIVGTWTYVQPGCAFTSENLLAKAGGEVAATSIKEKLSSTYSGIGIKSSNTKITLNSDQTFSATIGGKSLSGTYTFDESTGAITLKTLLLSLNGYVTGNSTGAGFLFESKKLLSILQTAAALSGNSKLQTIGNISKNYDGVRVGFDMKK